MYLNNVYKKRSKAGRAENVSGLLLAIIPVIGFVLFGLIPLVLAFVMAFLEIPGRGGRIEEATFAKLENFEAVLSDQMFWKSIGNTLIMALSLPICIVIALAFSRNVADKSVQLMCRTLAIISLSLMPLLILTCIYAWLRDAVIAVVAMAYSIAILVFLFIATAHQESASADARKEPLSSEIIQERYHITDRELEVIRLIKKG